MNLTILGVYPFVMERTNVKIEPLQNVPIVGDIIPLLFKKRLISQNVSYNVNSRRV